MAEDKKKTADPASETAAETKEEAKKDTPASETAKEKKKEEKVKDKKTADTDSGSKNATTEKEEFEVPAKFKNLVDTVEKMSVLELNELVKVLEKKFGVTAGVVAVAGAGAGVAQGDEAEEKTSFNVELKAVGDQKIAVIKAVKEALGLGLKEAKDLVDGAPAMLKEGVKKEDAEEMKKKIEEAGGQVELK